MGPRPRNSSISKSNASASEINDLGNSTKKELLYKGYYYDVTNWITYHPGGRIIEYYTQSGEDATIPIQQFHQRSTEKVMSIMKFMEKRPAFGKEIGTNITSQRHRALTEDFSKLYKELLDDGMFNPSIQNLIVRFLELIAFAAVGLYLMNAENICGRLLGIFSFSLYFGRTGWIQHEGHRQIGMGNDCLSELPEFLHGGGHNSLTGNPKVDKMIQKFVWGIGNGMAGSWWINQHNRHHAMPQRLHRDVDLETLPLVAFNAKSVKNTKQGKSFFVQYQVYLFLAIDTCIVAVLWKFYIHPRYVFKRRLYLEGLFMTIHYVILYHLGLVTYFMCMWLASIYLFGNFALSHTHLPVTKDSLHWVEYALLHTTNIEPSWWCDWWMGFLNYQIEHHLFPTMPQFRQPKIVPRIRELARKHGIPYRCVSYSEAIVQSFTNLHQVSKELNN